METQATGSCCHDWANRFAIVRILRMFSKPFVDEGEGEEEYYPTTYLAAVHEVLAATALVAQFLALVTGRSLSEFDYTTEVVIGSISMVMSSFCVGLAYRYLWLRAARSHLMAEPPTWASRFNSFAVIVMAISMNLCLCLWLIPNKKDITAEAQEFVAPLRAIGRGIIALCAFTLYGAYLGNLLEILSGPRSDTVKQTHKVFAVVYGLCVIYLLSMVAVLIEYKKKGGWGLDAFSWPMQLAVILWMVCLACVASFMPQEPALTMVTQVVSEGDEQDDAAADEPRNCSCPKWLVQACAIIKLLNQRLDSRVFYPKDYLGATHEVFGYTLIITWLLTLVVPKFQEQISQHPARPIIGSFNPCFGWDYPPASWIAVCLCSFNVYFSYRYAWLKLMRKQLLKDPQTLASKFNTFATYALGVSSNLWLCLWLIGPNPKDPVGADLDGPEVFWWSLHTAIFGFYANAAYASYLGNLLDIQFGPRKNVVELKHKVFASVYGLAAFYLLLVYTYSLANFEVGKQPAMGSSHFTQVADIVWMACLASVSSFLPQEPPMRTQTTVTQTIVSQVLTQASPGDA